MTKWVHSAPDELWPALGSLLSNFLETGLAGSFHPSYAFEENRFVLDRVQEEAEM